MSMHTFVRSGTATATSGPIIEGRQCPPCAQHRVLHGVFGLVRRPKHSVAIAAQFAAVLLQLRGVMKDLDVVIVCLQFTSFSAPLPMETAYFQLPVCNRDAIKKSSPFAGIFRGRRDVGSNRECGNHHGPPWRRGVGAVPPRADRLLLPDARVGPRGRRRRAGHDAARRRALRAVRRSGRAAPVALPDRNQRVHRHVEGPLPTRAPDGRRTRRVRAKAADRSPARSA